MMYAPLNSVGWPDWYLQISWFEYKTSSPEEDPGRDLGALPPRDHREHPTGHLQEGTILGVQVRGVQNSLHSAGPGAHKRLELYVGGNDA